MSQAAMDHVMASGRLSAATLPVMLVLAYRCGARSGLFLVRISTHQIADDARLSKRQTQRVLDACIEAGLLQIHAPATNREPALYRII